MNDHGFWYQFIPAYNNFEAWASHYLKREMFTDTMGTSFTMAHVAISVTVAIFLIIGALIYSSKVSANNEGRLVPEKNFGVRNLFELILGALMGVAEGIMGREKAEKYLPLVGTLVFFILFNNLIGLIPGFLPATDTLKTNVALSFTVFLLYNLWGLKENGFGYIKHFLGPVWWLSPLMLLIELVSHIARPVSLALRLMGNMFGDHKVLTIFFMLVPVLVPLPFYVLGILVCIVQTAVFSILTMVYIDMAVAHEGH